MKFLCPDRFTDRPGFLRPPCAAALTACLIPGGAAGALTALTLHHRGLKGLAVTLLAAAVGLVVVWLLLRQEYPRWLQRGCTLYRLACERELKRRILLGTVREEDLQLPGGSLICAPGPQTELSDLLPALAKGRRELFLLSPLSGSARDFLRHPGTREISCRVLDLAPYAREWELEEALCRYYGPLLRREGKLPRQPLRLPLELGRILRALWACACFALLSRVPGGQSWWYGRFCIVLGACCLVWALQWALAARARRRSRAPG